MDAPSIVHIHVAWRSPLPRRYVKPTHTIVKGGHFMIMNRAGRSAGYWPGNYDADFLLANGNNSSISLAFLCCPAPVGVIRAA